MADFSPQAVTALPPTGSRVISADVSTTDNSVHTLIAAQGVGLRAYLTTLLFSNSSATPVVVTITDGTTTLHVPVPATGGNSLTLATPFPGASNTAITIQSSAGVSTLYVSALGFTWK